MQKIIFLLVLVPFCFLFSQYSVETLSINSINASGDIAVNANGDIFVADYGNTLPNANGTKVYKINKDGSSEVFAEGLLGASGLDFDSQGNLYQSNIAGGKISKITPDGVVSTFAENNIFSPIGIVVGPADTVYCVDCSGQLLKIDPQGNIKKSINNPLFQCPNGLTMDENGNLYISNFANSWVVKITPDGKVSNLADIPGGGNAHIEYANGRLYVVARCVDKIYEVSLDGEIKEFAGSGDDGTKDGSAREATFRHLNGIAASPDGDTLYVNDVATAFPVFCEFNPSLNPVKIRMIVKNPTAIDSELPSFPEQIYLSQNYPNPFNPSTTISFNLSANAKVKLVIYDKQGRLVKILVNNFLNRGAHKAIWTAVNELGNSVPTGTYFYRLSINGDVAETRKMILLK